MQQQTTQQAKRRTLFDITEDLVALGELLEEKQGDISDEEEAVIIDEWLQSNLSNLHNKVDAYAGLIKDNEAAAVIFRNRASALEVKARYAEKRAQRLKDRMKDCLTNNMNLQKLIGEEFTLAVQANGGKQEIVIDEAMVPPEYCRLIQSPDVERIRTDIESGKALPFAKLKERGTHLRIK